MTAVATPLDATTERLDGGVATWLISAGGGNVDILAGAEALVMREPRQVAVLCGREDSRLASLCGRIFIRRFVDLSAACRQRRLSRHQFPARVHSPHRAGVCRRVQHRFDWANAVETLTLSRRHRRLGGRDWEAATAPLWTRPTTLVLHGPDTRIGAIDLELKFTEAAIGNLQIADYRNFAHGRHHWLAKRGEVSAILAFVSDNDRALAERTLALIPDDIPQARIEVAGSPVAAALASLVAALRLTGWAGVARGVDPDARASRISDASSTICRCPNRRQPPIRQGCRGVTAPRSCERQVFTPARLAAVGELERWRRALDSFRDRLTTATFGGVVLDYDGTIVDSRHRFDVACDAVTKELIRLLEGGGRLAVERAAARRFAATFGLVFRRPLAPRAHRLL